MDRPSESDAYPLHTAARLTQTQVLESLLSTSPKLTLKADEDGRLPLHWACTTASLPTITAILDATPKRGFDPDVQDSSGWTPLMIASSLRDDAGLPTINLLLARDAEVKIASNTGGTALHFATSKQNIDTVKRLLDAGATARVKDKRGQLPLHRAAAVGNVPLVKLLLERGKSPVDATDVDGLTALHHAISEGHGVVAVELLKHGADSSKKDGDDRLAIDCAPDATVRSYILRHAEMEGIDVIES
ncbi:putative ankyrin-repeat protein [Lithohypha guttulata]|uniref:putative ankyrin-repeat protein n=1 Tax=Lithohypha guttulata TaxID=1690604 RepID=UPI002DE073E4|nr:putative ankyrin-repeat protein [Lithohypha guttulata]